MTPEEQDKVAIGAIIGLLLVVGFVFFLATVVAPSAHKRRVATDVWLREHKCQVTGFYGRSGEYKVYTCDNGLYKENDL